MKRFVMTAVMLGSLSALSAQVTSPAQATQRPLDTRESDWGSGQPITGLLMDASCKTIASTRPAPGPTVDPSTGRVNQSGMTGSNAQSMPGETGKTKTETEARSSAATAGPSQASATGTTGASVGTVPPQSGNVQNTKPVQGPGAADSSSASDTGVRARTADPSTVREAYKDCLVKPETAAFAIHTDGKVYVLDTAGNEMVAEQMRNEAFRASMSDPAGKTKWMTVTVVGTTSGDTLTIRSVRK